jgi:gas vesicle protein
MAEKLDSNAGYFLAGLIIGSLVSIFFAPKSGEGKILFAPSISG